MKRGVRTCVRECVHEVVVAGVWSRAAGHVRELTGVALLVGRRSLVRVVSASSARGIVVARGSWGFLAL